jgi:hypothetical protein
LEDERKANLFTCLSAHAERFFLFHIGETFAWAAKLVKAQTNYVEKSTKFIGFIG